MSFIDSGALRATPIDPLELYSTNALINELQKRHAGFFFAAYTLPRCTGEYPPQICYDTDLDTLAAVSEIGGKAFDLAAKEMGG